MSKPIRLVLALSLSLGLGLLAGCGGHGSGSSDAATDTILFNNGKVAAVSDAAKAADEAKLDATFGASWSPDGSAMAHQLVAMMGTMPEFRRGGISTDGTAWGQYTDGLYTAYFTNDPDAPAASAAAVRTVAPTAARAKAAVGARDLPEKPVAYVFSALEAARSGSIPAVAAELATAGYTVRSQGGSLAEWSQVNGAGILVNNSHGATLDGVFYLQTSDLVSDALTAQYKTEIEAGHIASGSIDVVDDSPQGYHIEKHYIFRSEYLEGQANYASMFGKNSLFFNLACSGGSREASRFYGPLFSRAGLGVYGGWSNTVLSDDTLELAGFFFDRALGLNKVAPVDPGLPAPASVSSIESTIGTAAHQDGNSGAMNHSSTVEGKRRLSVHFGLFRATNQSLTTIVPSEISAGLTTDGANLEIKGDFGADQGTVTVAGVSVAVVSWSANSIVTAKPAAGGAVVVTSPAGLIGNPVPLTGALSIDPVKPSVAFSSTTTFTVSNGSGSFPSGTKFVWTVKGDGTVGGASTTTTTVPHIDYLAPGKAASDTITVVVKAADGTSLGTTGTTIAVGSVFNLNPSTLAIGVPLYGSNVYVADTTGLPAGTQYLWTVGVGTVSLSQGAATSQSLTTTQPHIYYAPPDPFLKTGAVVGDAINLQILDASGKVLGSGRATVTLGGQSYMDITYPYDATHPALRYPGPTRTPSVRSAGSDYDLFQCEIPNGNGGDLVDFRLCVSPGASPGVGDVYTWKDHNDRNRLPGDLNFIGTMLAANDIVSGTLTITSTVPAADGGTLIGYSFNFTTTGAPIFGYGVQNIHP